MARPASLLSPPAPGGEEEEAEDASPRLLPRSSPTPRPRPVDEEAAPRGEASGERRVRFADTLGLPLVAVQCYDSLCCAEFPGLPLLETQRHGSMCCSETIGYPLVAAQGHGSLCCNEACGLPLVEAECCARLCPAQSPDPAQDLGALGHSEQGLQSFFYLCPTFLLPASPQQLEQRVQSSGVELESLLPCPTDARALRGVLRVLNISYRKSVYVRATFDRWASFYDHPADYLAPCDDGRTDQFAFRLAFAPPYTHDGARLEFVARYETPDQIFWANNGGRNYGVVLKATGSTPVAPPFKPVFWELEQRRLKSCLKPLKNRSAEEVSGADNIPNNFLPAGLAIGQDDVPQLLKPTPLHPERPSNQVPTLLVTSTSPEKFHSYRPMTFAESTLEHATKKGGYMITPPESLMGLQNPCEEEEDVHCPRRDKSTWIGDLNTLRHAGSRFANGEEDIIRKDMTREKSLLERPIDRPAAGRSKLPSYIPPTSEDSDNEDAVEKELEQLYLSHLSRLQAAKELKEPVEEEAGKGISKEPCPGTGWHAPVSPLDFTSSKRVLNTWLVEEISLRHANGRDQEELIDVAQEDVELPSSSGESSPLHPEGQSVQNEISSGGQVEESMDNPSARQVEQATPNKESSEVIEKSASMNLPSIPSGGIFSTEEHAKLSALGHPHNKPSYSPLVLPDVKAADFVMSSLSYESCPVTRDNTKNLPCRPASTPVMVHSSTDARGKILPETEEDRIFQDFQLEREDFFQGNALDALSRNSDRHWEIKQQKQSILQRGELSGIETSRNQQEIVKRSEESSRLEMSRNLIENVLLKEDLSGLKNSSNLLQERVLLSEELSGPEATQNLQEVVLLRENLSGREASQDLQEIILLKEELTGLESSQNVKGNGELCEGHSALEIPRHEQEHVQVGEAFSDQKTSQNLQEIILLSGELFGIETAQNLQESILLSEELCGQETSHNLQEIVLLSEELSGVESSESLLESTLQIEELCEMGTPQSLQEAVLLDEEHSELEISQNLQEMIRLKEETFELESSHILPLSGEGCWDGSTLSAPIHEGLEYLKSSTTPLGQGCKYQNSSSIPQGESVEYTHSCTTPLDARLEHYNSFSSLLSEGLEYSDFLTPPMDKGLEEHDSSSAQLDEGFSYPHSSSVLVVVKRHDKDPNLILNAAVTQSLCVVCALLFLLVMLQGCTAFVAVLLYLMSVWFL